MRIRILACDLSSYFYSLSVFIFQLVSELP